MPCINQLQNLQELRLENFAINFHLITYKNFTFYQNGTILKLKIDIGKSFESLNVESFCKTFSMAFPSLIELEFKYQDYGSASVWDSELGDYDLMVNKNEKILLKIRYYINCYFKNLNSYQIYESSQIGWH